MRRHEGELSLVYPRYGANLDAFSLPCPHPCTRRRPVASTRLPETAVVSAARREDLARAGGWTSPPVYQGVGTQPQRPQGRTSQHFLIRGRGGHIGKPRDMRGGCGFQVKSKASAGMRLS